MCFSNLEFGEWKTRNMKMPSPGTTFLKRRLKWWPEGLHCPLYSWQHLLVYKVTTGNVLDGLTLLPEHKMEMNSPTLRCLKGYDPRLVSRENRAICHIRISLFLLRVLHSVHILKKKSLKCLKNLAKVLLFSIFNLFCLWTWQEESVTSLFQCVMEGACSLQALQQDAFQKQQQIWEQKALRKMSNAERKERDFRGTRPQLQRFMKINWAWMSLSLNRECLCEQKKCLPIACPCPAGGSSLLGLSTLCREFGVKPHQPENCISPG